MLEQHGFPDAYCEMNSLRENVFTQFSSDIGNLQVIPMESYTSPHSNFRDFEIALHGY